MSDIILWIFLGINTLTDIKNHTIYIAVTFLFGALGTVIFACAEDGSLLSLVSGTVVGIGLMLLSVLSKGAVGFGDGLVVAVTGIWLGGWKTALVLMGGFLLAAFFGVAGICAGRVNRKSEIPFVPFFSLSYFIFYMGGML